MRRQKRSLVLTCVTALALQGCREPTQITVEIWTDIDCADRPRTGISVGKLSDLEGRPMSTETRRCDPSTGRIGSIVLVPGGEKDADVAVRVVTGITMSADDCVANDYKGGCVVARRALAFRPAEPLYLPIEIEASCIDVPCGATQTCKSGVCVSAVIEDPSACASDGGCDVTVPSGFGGSTGQAGAEAKGGGQGSGALGGTSAMSGGGPPLAGSSGAGGASPLGTAANAGMESMGGMPATSGAGTVGGTITAGGAGFGASSPFGGSGADGGNPAAGGSVSLGGATETGGASAFGGASTGGSIGVGGSFQAGGANASGGSLPIEGGSAGSLGSAGGAATGGSVSGGGAATDQGGRAGGGGAGTGAVEVGGSGATSGSAGTNGGASTLHTLVVTTVADISDGSVASIAALVASPGADGAISLREALEACNNTPNTGGPDLVRFDIPGPRPHTIVVGTTTLPYIVDAIYLDGQSEPDFATTPVIELDGATLGATTSTDAGLSLLSGSDGSTVRGLAISGFPGPGLLIDTAGGHVIQNNYLGLRANGARHDNIRHGLHISDSAGNTVGGSLLANPRQGNVASGNTQSGILLAGPNCHHNVVSGNIAGLDPTMTAKRRNNANGVFIATSAHDNMIGGPSPEFGNVLSGNFINGLRISDSATYGNIVQNNFFGTDAAFSSLGTLGNTNAGIRILAGAHDNLIGGDQPSLGNKFRFNLSSAIIVNGGNPQSNAILGNQMYESSGPGIDLGADAATTPNDSGDVDTGPNNLLNFPEFVQANYGSGWVSIDYLLDVPAGTYRIEFFVSAVANPIGFGNGEQFAHAEVIQHGGTGPEPFSTSFLCDASAYVTATVTEMLGANSYGGTSEFSMAIPTTY